MQFHNRVLVLLHLGLLVAAHPVSDSSLDLSKRSEDADDAVAYAWVVGPPEKIKRAAEDADDAVAYAWVVGPPKGKSKRRAAEEDADDAVAYAWVVGPPQK